jgi:hypothetical protein
MNRFVNYFTAIAASCFAAAALAAPPKQLITHNRTDFESNAFVAGSIPSQHPTKPHADNMVYWAAVKMACFQHTSGDKCSALIKMATNTANPIDVGILSIDLKTGQITPDHLSANGFTISVNGPGETTITKD